MLPLTLAKTGEKLIVVKIGGSPEVKKHLEDLGFVEGEEISVVSAHEGDMIIRLKDTTLAVVQGMAAKIMVREG